MCDMKTRRYAHIIPVLRIAVWYIDDDNVNSVVLLLCWTLGNTVVLRVGQLAWFQHVEVRSQLCADLSKLFTLSV